MLLSVIIPVYNTEKYLPKCINSVLNQTFRDFEIILVNDGSADSCGKICDEYGEKYEFVKVIHQKNNGVTNARKTGFKASRGEYISFIDSDDYIDENMYSVMTEGVFRNNADIVSCNIIEESNEIRVLKNRIEPGFYNKELLKKQVYPKFVYDFSVCRPGVIPSLCNKLIKRSLLCDVVENMNEEVVFGEDAIWSFSAIMKAESMCIIDKEFYHYRNPKSFTAKEYNQNAFKKIILLSEEMEKQIGKCGKQVYGYITKYVLECIRGELVCNKKIGYKERCRIAKAYLENERIQNSLKESIPEIKDKKLKIKLYFARKRIMLPLFIPFYFNSLRKGKRWFEKTDVKIQPN